MSKTWARFIALMPFLFCGTVFAQSANESANPFEFCSRSARLADEACKSEIDPKQRLDCFNKVSAGQLQCLEHAEEATAYEDPSNIVPLVPPANAAADDSLQGPSQGPSRQMGESKPGDEAKPADNKLPLHPPAGRGQRISRANKSAATASLPKNARAAKRKDGPACIQADFFGQCRGKGTDPNGD
jgi:hypothetical protein